MRVRSLGPGRWGRRPASPRLVWLWATMLAGVLFALVACEADDAEPEPEADPDDEATVEVDAPEDGELRIRLIHDIANLDPAHVPAGPDERVASGIFEGLVQYEPDSFEVELVLAEEFESSDDGLRHDFTLKEGIQFHGGYGELTADDVKFSFERIAGLTDPPVESLYADDWGALEEVEVHDDYSGTIVLSEPFSPLMTSTLPILTGTVVSRDAVEELGEDFGTNPIGTGPYEFESWTPNQHVVLTRFDDYSGANEDLLGGREVHWDSIQFLPIEDDSAADIAIETGEVHFGRASLDGVDRLQDTAGIAMLEATALDYYWVGMNMEHPDLEDERVREAIRHAIDVPTIIDAAYEGRWERATAAISPNMPVGHWADAPTYEQDLDRAQELLTEAGVEDLSLTFTFMDETGASTTAEIVQANLAEIGIDVQLEQQDSATFYDVGEHLRDRQLFYTSFETEPDPSWVTMWFVCDQLDEWNWMYFCDEEFDELHRAATEEFDETERQAMYEEMQRIWDEAANSVWLAWPTRYFAHSDGIEAMVTPAGFERPWAFQPAE